jgi:hypothetical protein
VNSSSSKGSRCIVTAQPIEQSFSAAALADAETKLDEITEAPLKLLENLLEKAALAAPVEK